MDADGSYHFFFFLVKHWLRLFWTLIYKWSRKINWKCVWAQSFRISKPKLPKGQFNSTIGKAIRKIQTNIRREIVQFSLNLRFFSIPRWVVIFSHPSDFTPVCTTELGRIAVHQPHFTKRNVKLLAHSVDDLKSHVDWVNVCIGSDQWWNCCSPASTVGDNYYYFQNVGHQIVLLGYSRRISLSYHCWP